VQLGRTPELKQSKAIPNMMVALLTGGSDKPYVLGLTTELLSRGIGIDLIGSDELDCPELNNRDGLNFLNLRGDLRSNVDISSKMARVLRYYWKLLRYAASAKPKIFHILWNNKFESFDRTLLMLYYKLLGKSVVLTAHNVNAGRRDSKDTVLNRLTLRIQYLFADTIFVHTEKMKRELVQGFRVAESHVSVIPFGINNTVPNTSLTPDKAKIQLGFRNRERTILFFGRITPYKGLEYLITSLRQLSAKRDDYRLIIAGRPDNCEQYWNEIRQSIQTEVDSGQILLRSEFIPDEMTEVYFKAADVLALPYRHIYQSGVLFLGYGFGVPVLAADVGSLKDDVVEGKTGFTFTAEDSVDLSATIEKYFASDLYTDLAGRREEIRTLAAAQHSWATVGALTLAVYAGLLGENGLQSLPSTQGKSFSHSQSDSDSAEDRRSSGSVGHSKPIDSASAKQSEVVR
jgi:glycosyltransferase involved in cell wall biosynthesis